MSLDKKLAILCKASYVGLEEIENLYEYIEVSLIEDKKTDTECFICVTENDAVHIVFRGTEPDSRRDWATDLDFRSVDFLGQPTHSGFVKAIRAIGPKLKEALSQHKGKEMYFTGHSLGGALALLAPMWLGLKPTRIVTFGQPKTIHKAASEFIQGAPYVRYVNNSDIVPKIPFKWMAKYRHFGELKYFDKNGVLHTNPDHLFRFLDGVGSFWGRIEDHSIDRYIELVR